MTSGRCLVTVNSIFPCVRMCIYEQESRARECLTWASRSLFPYSSYPSFLPRVWDLNKSGHSRWKTDMSLSGSTTRSQSGFGAT